MQIRSLTKLFWSFLAGISLSLIGCEEDKKPTDAFVEELRGEGGGILYGPPDFYDTSASDEIAIEEEWEDVPAVMYGPPTP